MVIAVMLIPAYGEGRIQQRKENQQDRIAQGVASGQLTAGETANLENKESKLNREVRRDRLANGGTLTPAERRQVNRQQNRFSRSIYRDKHNGVAQQK
ncbi:MAG TPA: hypothetical protein VJ732_14705 [Bryobacteraceae bacterium]|nr:hypothetical protein [Bryobacteraceae bacterium]